MNRKLLKKIGRLVMTRKVNQRILLGDPPFAAISVVAIHGKRVQLGVKTLDPALPINRQEVYEDMERNGRTRA